MNEKEWDVITGLLEHAWKGEWDDDKAAAYYVLLRGYTSDQVVSALHRLAQSGKPFLPAAPEIVKAVNDAILPPAPSWSEAWTLIERAMRLYTSFPDTERVFEVYLERTKEEFHPVVVAFIQHESLPRLVMTEFYDPEYGGMRLRDLERRYLAFVESAQDRLERGLAIEARHHRQVTPQRIGSIIAGEPRSLTAELEAGGE